MKLRLTTLTFFILSLTATALAQQAKIEGYVTNQRGKPVTRVRIVVTPGGQVGTTDSKGHFIISLPSSVQPGQAAQIRVARANWVIFSPMFGKCDTKSAVRNYEPLPVVIVPLDSPLSYEPKRLSEFVDALKKQTNRQAQTIGALGDRVGELERQRERYNFLDEYAKEYGISSEKLKSALDGWAQIKESDDKLEQARKEYWLGNLEKVDELTGEAGPGYVENLEKSKKEFLGKSRKTISNYMLKGRALYDRYKFREALGSYKILKELFDRRVLSKEDLPGEWGELGLWIGNAKQALGARVEGREGNNLLSESEKEYRQLLAIYTREASPQDWAATQINLGLVLRIRGERVGGGEGVRLLGEAVEACKQALTVYTREAMPQDWAAMQNSLGLALRAQGEQVGGEKGARLLEEAVEACKQALTIYTREAMPQDWAMTQDNIGTVLYSQGKRLKGEEGVRLLAEAIEACRQALTIYKRELLPQKWATTQNNLGAMLFTLAERSSGEESVRLLGEAVEAYKQALRVRTREELPQDWAATQNNLGAVLSFRGKRVKGEEGMRLLAESVDAHRQALTVYTREELPRRWAGTQNNLGVALGSQGKLVGGEEGVGLLKEAIEAYRQALTVRTLEGMPEDRSITQNNLGEVYARLEDWPNAAQSFVNVLAVHPKDERAYRIASLIYHDILFNKTAKKSPAFRRGMNLPQPKSPKRG